MAGVSLPPHDDASVGLSAAAVEPLGTAGGVALEGCTAYRGHWRFFFITGCQPPTRLANYMIELRNTDGSGQM